MRSFRDRDFIQTNEGFFFCVIGSLHPIDRVISYIKYVPSTSGIWGSGEIRFSRVLKKYTIPNLLETFNFLKQNYPEYMFNSPMDNITITAVPHNRIKKHFLPEQKLAQLRKSTNLDALQEKLIRFTDLLTNKTRVPENSFGVTGSVILDIHQPAFSDLDIIVYGINESWKMKKVLCEDNDESILKRIKGKALDNWCIKKTQQYPLNMSEALKLYERKWNLGFFEDTWVSIHPVKLECEIKKFYGQEVYVPCGQVTIRAEVCENIESLFLPAIYEIEDVKFLDTNNFVDIKEVVSYEGLYDSLAEKEEVIQAKGKLELVKDLMNNKQYYRVLVGSPEGKGTEYIKIVD